MISHIQTNDQGAFLRFINAGDNIEWDEHNYCTAFYLEKDGKADQFHIHQFYTTAQPTFDPITQSVNEVDPALADGKWTQQWVVSDLAPETISANQAAALEQAKKSYEAALDAHFLAAAKAKGYDTQYTCALRAGYPGPFHDEGVAFATWMDNCNVAAFTLMSQVLAGAVPMPSMEDFLAGLPVLTWPQA